MQLGRLNVDQMLGELTPEQFDEWQAFALLRPFGTAKAAEQLATLIAIVQAFATGDACQIPDILRAWGYDVPEDRITEADVMSAEDSIAAAKLAFGIA